MTGWKKNWLFGKKLTGWKLKNWLVGKKLKTKFEPRKKLNHNIATYLLKSKSIWWFQRLDLKLLKWISTKSNYWAVPLYNSNVCECKEGYERCLNNFLQKNIKSRANVPYSLMNSTKSSAVFLRLSRNWSLPSLQMKPTKFVKKALNKWNK